MYRSPAGSAARRQACAQRARRRGGSCERRRGSSRRGRASARRRTATPSRARAARCRKDTCAARARRRRRAAARPPGAPATDDAVVGGASRDEREPVERHLRGVRDVPPRAIAGEVQLGVAAQRDTARGDLDRRARYQPDAPGARQPGRRVRELERGCAAAQPDDAWSGDDLTGVARALAPTGFADTTTARGPRAVRARARAQLEGGDVPRNGDRRSSPYHASPSLARSRGEARACRRGTHRDAGVAFAVRELPVAVRAGTRRRARRARAVALARWSGAQLAVEPLSVPRVAGVGASPTSPPSASGTTSATAPPCSFHGHADLVAA